MITCTEIPETNIIEVTIEGKIEAPEFEATRKKLETIIARHGKVRVLEHVVSFESMPPSKVWEDIRFGFKHGKDVERVAVVTDKTWIEIFTKLVTPFIPAEVKFFDAAEIEQARSWLRA